MNSINFISRSLLLKCLFFIILTTSSVQTYAQFNQFGKNRVQYEDFRWRFIQSEHFDIYYYSSKNYNLGTFTAQTLESAYKQISEDFRHDIADRIEILIYDSHNDFTQTNVPVLPIDAEGIGGVTDLFKNRITMPFMGDWRDFRRVIHHELVHAVINDMFFGGTIQSVISGNVNLRIPGWFNEGMAEYSALGWDTETDMFIRDAVIKGYLPPIPRLGGFFAYRGGQAVWNYIVEEYGREKIGEIFQRLKLTRSVDAAFKQSLGLNVNELSSRWQDALRERYFPEVSERQSIEEISTPLTTRERSGSFNTSPEVSPSGDKVAMITNERGLFDVIVVSAVTGEKIKTLIKGEDNVNFEQLNILNPNLDWSPDGKFLTLSSRSKGNDHLAIVEYSTGDIKMVSFPGIDAIQSVSWSPDGKKIAFDGNIGPLQDIFIYDIENENVSNLTNDVFTDKEPAWDSDSEHVYFISNRGDKLNLNTYKLDYNQWDNDSFYQFDMYRIKVGDKQATRMTKTTLWDESQPQVLSDGTLLYISDQNGIPNIYKYDFDTRTIDPLTDLQTGVRQMSISGDGDRLVVNSINEGFLDLYLVKSPMNLVKGKQLSLNYWAKRRNSESTSERVPATKYAEEMYGTREEEQPVTPPADTLDTLDLDSLQIPVADSTAADTLIGQKIDADVDETKDTDEAPADSVMAARTDTTKTAKKDTTDQEDKTLDFRNYVFGEADSTQNDTTKTAQADTAKTDTTEAIDFRNYTFGDEVYEEVEGLEDARKIFEPEDTRTDSGRFQPKSYRLKFSPDITAASGAVGTFGAFGLVQFAFSDLLGDHRLTLSSNLVFDLRDSDYVFRYSYLKNRTNYHVNIFHTSRTFQTFTIVDTPGGPQTDIERLRFRTLGGGINMEYPINKFKRIEYGANVIATSQDVTQLSGIEDRDQSNAFVRPEISFINDQTLRGFLTPRAGNRYSATLSASPPFTSNTLGFVSLTGDARKYFNLGFNGLYTLAVRGSGGISFGGDSQSFFMGGMNGWINRQFSNNSFPIDDLEDLFITVPANPLRGFEYNSIFGDRYALFNVEFRFPLIAALLPGPIPFIPLQNIQAVGFFDAGAAWGQDIALDLGGGSSFGIDNASSIVVNDSDLDFKFFQEETIFIKRNLLQDGQVEFEEVTESEFAQLPPEERAGTADIARNDILMGTGFGLRSIILGLPFRYDLGWRFNGSTFKDPIHYFTLGIDF